MDWVNISWQWKGLLLPGPQCCIYFMINFGVRGSKVKVTRGWRWIWRPGRGVTLDPFWSINQSMKLYVYTAPVKVRLSQAPPTSRLCAQTRQFSTIAWTVPVRCPRSSNCQADCSTLWGRKHGSFWVQNGQCVCVRWSVLHGQRIVVRCEGTESHQFSMVSGS